MHATLTTTSKRADQLEPGDVVRLGGEWRNVERVDRTKLNLGGWPAVYVDGVIVTTDESCGDPVEVQPAHFAPFEHEPRVMFAIVASASVEVAW